VRQGLLKYFDINTDVSARHLNDDSIVVPSSFKSSTLAIAGLSRPLIAACSECKFPNIGIEASYHKLSYWRFSDLAPMIGDDRLLE
jgi:hypothetical protein